jgi:hypothetical protein
MFKRVQPHAQSGDDCGLNPKRAWLGLLLSFLFLYNPFLVVPGSSAHLSASRPPSFRATVASSQLFTLKNSDSIEGLAMPASDSAEGPILVHMHFGPVGRIVSDDGSLPDSQLCSVNLWFRPPPAPSSIRVFQEK